MDIRRGWRRQGHNWIRLHVNLNPHVMHTLIHHSLDTAAAAQKSHRKNHVPQLVGREEHADPKYQTTFLLCSDSDESSVSSVFADQDLPTEDATQTPADQQPACEPEPEERDAVVAGADAEDSSSSQPVSPQRSQTA